MTKFVLGHLYILAYAYGFVEGGLEFFMYDMYEKRKKQPIFLSTAELMFILCKDLA